MTAANGAGSMGLDFVILKEGGGPERFVSLDWHEHARFARRVESDYIPILNRVTDYLADEVFVPAELPALREAFLIIQSRADARDTQKMKDMIALIDFAIEKGMDIKVIPD
jgi:hypothetical protein